MALGRQGWGAVLLLCALLALLKLFVSPRGVRSDAFCAFSAQRGCHFWASAATRRGLGGSAVPPAAQPSGAPGRVLVLAAASGAVTAALLRASTRGVSAQRAGSVVACKAGVDLSGKWGCFKTEGDINAYWKACGLPWFARKGLEVMDWGAGKNTNYREFTQDGDSITMEYSFDGPGMGGLSFTERYVVGEGVQEITRMGGATILVDPVWESGALKITNRTPPESSISFGFVPSAFRKLFTGGAGEEIPEEEQEDESKPRGEMLDVHTFALDGDTLVMTADSTASGGPVVKWFLKKE